MFGLVHIGMRLPYKKVGLVSFTSYVASHKLDLAGLGGGAVRFRIYTSFGLGAAEIAEIIGFTTITFWLGLFAAGKLAFLVSPIDLTGQLGWLGSTRWLGAFLLALLFLYIVLALFLKRPIRVRGWEFRLPSAPNFAAQIPLAVLDLTASALVV